VIAKTRLAAVLGTIALGLAACGGDGGTGAPTTRATTTAAVVEETTTTRAVEAPLTTGTFPSGATVEYPGNWTSYGVGASTGSLELAIPQTANVSLRDAAASEYICGPMFSGAESAEGAFSVLAVWLSQDGITPQTFTSEAGREVLYAVAEVNGADSLFAVTESGDSYASVFAPSLAGPLSADTVAAVLEAFASLNP